MITYDNCSVVRVLHNFANAIEMKILGWKLQYNTNNNIDNKEKREATISKELFIFNYKLKAGK
ncbi:MAG: hypothetical protein QXL94_04005 [Candidatus Parvarchaeum sp.]